MSIGIEKTRTDLLNLWKSPLGNGTQETTTVNPNTTVSPNTTEEKKDAAVDAVAGQSYTTRSGDSLWRVARQALGAGASNGQVQSYVREIAKKNQIANPDRLRVGQKLEPPSSNITADNKTSQQKRQAVLSDSSTQQLRQNVESKVPDMKLDKDGNLNISGTSANETFAVSRDGENVKVTYSRDGVTQTSDFKGVKGRVNLDSGDGDDRVTVQGDKVTVSGKGKDVYDVTGNENVVDARANKEAAVKTSGRRNFTVGQENVALIYQGDEGGAKLGKGSSITAAGNKNVFSSEGTVINVAGDENRVEAKNGSQQDLNLYGKNNVADRDANDRLVEKDLTSQEGQEVVKAVKDAKMSEVDLSKPSTDGSATYEKTTRNALSDLITNFPKAPQKNGIIARDTLAKYDGAKALADKSDLLMFASVEMDNAQAWRGLSKKDLEVISARMAKGETLEAIADDVMRKSWLGQELAKTNPSFTQADFLKALEAQRRQRGV